MTTNSFEDSNYDPIAVEAAIDDAYTQSEELGEYQEPVEDALEKIEKLPYAVHEDNTYGQEELRATLEGLAQLGDVSHQPTMNTAGDALAVASEIFSHDDESLSSIMSMTENLENMEEKDRMEQATEYSQIIDQIGETVVTEAYEPVAEEASQDQDLQYGEDTNAEELIEEVAKDAEIGKETFKQAAMSVAQFKGELLPETETV